MLGLLAGLDRLVYEPANDFRIVIKTVDEENGDVHFRGEE
jgi:hypothetical protein